MVLFAKDAAALTHGQASIVGTGPTGVFAHYDTQVTDLRRALCSGTLVTPGAVLTSATCVRTLRGAASQGVARRGEILWMQGADMSTEQDIVAQLDSAVLHPRHDPTDPVRTATWDLAVVPLARTSRFTSMCLVDLPPVLEQRNVRLSGYGETGAGHRLGGKQLSQRARFVPRALDDGAELWTTLSGHDMAMACDGDSGGSVVVQTTDDRELALLGVISHAGSACDLDNLFGETRIAQVPAAMEFILANAPGARVCRNVVWEGYGEWMGATEPSVGEPGVGGCFGGGCAHAAPRPPGVGVAFLAAFLLISRRRDG